MDETKLASGERGPGGAIRMLRALACGAMAIIAAALPFRWTAEWEGRLPIRRMAFPSAILAIASGVSAGLIGFLAYAGDLATRNAAATLDLAARQAAAGPAGQPAVTTATPIFLSMFAIFFFALTTPRGLLATYLTFSGLYRAIVAILDEPSGDPVLTDLDRRLLDWRRRASEARSDRQRRRLAGPEVPDRLLTGASAGVPGADYVLVASRRKEGWEPGVVILSGGRWFRIGTPSDRMLPVGLRTLYPLKEVNDAEALRRWMSYELPPIPPSSSSR